MVARSDFQRVLRPGSGRRTAGRPLSGPRGRRVVRAVKVLRIQLMPRKKNRVLVHLDGLEDIEPLEIAQDVMEHSGIHVGKYLGNCIYIFLPLPTPKLFFLRPICRAMQ